MWNVGRMSCLLRRRIRGKSSLSQEGGASDSAAHYLTPTSPTRQGQSRWQIVGRYSSRVGRRLSSSFGEVLMVILLGA